MNEYNFQKIESKWQKHWSENNSIKCDINAKEKNFYNLCMYPYPSGDLHMGHIRNYTIGDVITRYKMLNGYNVLSPMGWDSFGLPAENAAIKTGIHPKTFTEERINNMKDQIIRLGSLPSSTNYILACCSLLPSRCKFVPILGYRGFSSTRHWPLLDRLDVRISNFLP